MSRFAASPIGPFGGATRLDAVVICAVLLSGLLHVTAPFGGDQFLFVIGAQKIAHHGVIYRDFWDLKQPLIYYLYALAGLLFGFSQTGVHLFDALYQSAFAAIIIAACARHFRSRWAASLAPLLAIGAYEFFANDSALASVEALAGLPLFLAAVLAASALVQPRGSAGKAFLAGCAGAVAVNLKFVFLPLVLAVWLVAVAIAMRRGERAAAARTSVLLAAGFAVTLAAFACYFQCAGVLDVALRTTLVEPPQILRHLSPEYRSPTLAETRTFASAIWPLALLAIAGIAARRRALDTMSVQLIAWLVTGTVVIGAEVWSYYYKFFILVVPLGILAAGGLEALAHVSIERGRRAQVAFAAVLTLMLASSARTAINVGSGLRVFASEQRQAVAPSVTFLSRAAARPGPIYIFGDPRIYYFSGRDQAVAINGYSPALFPRARWHELVGELQAAGPPYIKIDRDYEPSVRTSPETMHFIASSYRVAMVSGDGTWYERR